MRESLIAILRVKERAKHKVLLHSAEDGTLSSQASTVDNFSVERTVVAESNQRLNVGHVGTTGTRYIAILFAAALALGWIADYLFYGHSFGISVPIFVVFVLSALAAVSLLHGVRPAIRNFWLLVPLLFFALMITVRDNGFLTFLNFVMTLFLLFLFLSFYAAGRIEQMGLLGYPVSIVTAAVRSLIASGPGAILLTQAVSLRRPRSGFAVPVLRGILVALPVLILFAALLASADAVFQKLITDAFGAKAFEKFPDMLSHLVFILVVAWCVAGGLLVAINKSQAHGAGADRKGELPGNLHVASLFGFVEGATVLVLVNLLFMVFAWIQFANIFFGQPAGIPYEEYRDYVRRGFGELLIVCVLTIGLILGVRLLARVSTPRQAMLLQVLSTIMVALTFVMLISAYRRMDAWEGVQFYINTQVRIYVRAFIIWLGIVFAWLTVTMWFRRDRFAIGAFAAALGFMVTINLANPDADVAAANLKRNDELSIRYLYQLSDDAVPVLIQGFHETTDAAIKSTLRTELTQRLAILKSDPDLQNWQSFHLARSQAYELLSDLKNRGELAPAP